MEKFHRPQILKTKDLRIPNYYTQALNGEFKEFAFNEERTLEHQGKWRSEVFAVRTEHPMDLEIGTGNGVHFQHHCQTHPQRAVLGMELKFKPLIQSVRGMLRNGSRNGRMLRFHAFNMDQVFAGGELDDIYIHFPDPWTAPRKPQNRVVNARMLKIFWDLQRPGSKIDFKTDSREMFLWAMEQIKQSPYQIEMQTLDLHRSAVAGENVLTGFEKIFLRQGIEINFVRLRRG